MNLAADFSTLLPTIVIAEMLGIPVEDRERFKRWNDVLLDMGYTVPGGEGAAEATAAFIAATAEMGEYVDRLLADRRTAPRDDLLARLGDAELDGARLTPSQIVGFFQLLLLAGSETTTNLINNVILCFIDHPDQLAKLKATPGLLPSAIEEILRFRSPLQGMYRVTTRELEMHGRRFLRGSLCSR